MVSGGQSAEFMVYKYGGNAAREGRCKRMRETALAALQAVMAEPPRVSLRRVRMPEPNTGDWNGYRSCPQENLDRGAVAQAPPATSRAQDDLGLLRLNSTVSYT